MKKERGITLVALVITVIIMLILAGVALSLITGEEGLFARTNHAASLYKDVSQVEADKVDSVVSELEKYSGGPIPTLTPPQTEQGGPTPTLTPPITEQGGTLITELALKGTLKVGDYIEYDAGKWEESDLAKITASGGKLNGTTTVTKDLPENQGEFGGFEIGDSRNSNSTHYLSEHTPRTEGWRVWNIDENTGEVTIIHAGYPETLFCTYHESEASIKILRKRDCSMYENSYAKGNSAHFLIGWEAAEWYTKNCLTDEERTSGLVYELESYDEDVDDDGETGESNFNEKTFALVEDNPVIEVLEIGSDYWLASAKSRTSLFGINPDHRSVRDFAYYCCGVRPLVTLKTNILLKQDGQTDGEWNQWKITGSAN